MRRHISSTVLLLVFCTSFRTFAALTANNLTCDHLENPQGIDTAQPRLSWLINSSQRDATQTAYEILVAYSEKNLAGDDGDLWNSGKVDADTSILVPYAGQPLASRTQCFWKVRVWDNHGNASTWSKPATWSMGIVSSSEWRAQWIGIEGADITNHLIDAQWITSPESISPTNFFRRMITVPAGRVIRHADFEFTGDADCQGWLNQISLAGRNGRDAARMVRWNDLTTRLEPGQTYAFSILAHHSPNSSNSPAVVGKLTVEFADGGKWSVSTDTGWKVSGSPNSDWTSPLFKDTKWADAKVLGPVGSEPWGNVVSTENRVQPARYLRREFVAEKNISRATVSFCGLGLSELYINGNKIGDAVLSPAFAQYDKREFSVSYDVTKNLRPGANALGVILGNGRFFADRSKTFGGTMNFGWPKLLLNLHIEYSDGSWTNVVSDQTWKLTTDGPIRANNDYDGETYDARKEFPGWSSSGFNDATWEPAQVVPAAAGELSAQMIQPIRVTGTIKPVSVKEIKRGVFIYDLGQNMVGWCRLHVTGPAGREIFLRHAETLAPDGSLYMANLRGAEVTDSYTLKGGGLETWEPRFITHGFRYVEVIGYPGKPGLKSLEGRVVNDDLPVAGSFQCSNDLLNRIYTNIVWGTRGNYRSTPTDCPQRDERQGWLGDRSQECIGESYLFDISPLYAKWRQDMADSQRPNGMIGDVSPSFWPVYSDDVTWPSTAMIIPGMLQRQFGDNASISNSYTSAVHWLDHVLTYVTNNLISRDAYGDWCVPPEDPILIHSRDPARQTDKTVLATTYFYYDLCLMENYAHFLGKEDDADRWHILAANIKDAFNNKYLDRDKRQYSNGTQTSCVLPLAFKLAPDDLRGPVFDHLVGNIENVTHGHIGTGVVGSQFINRVLTDNGRADLVYTMATQTNYPGWGYMVRNGATTIWELWNGNTADPAMNSGNHVMLVGDLVVWFYEDLAGIAPDDAQPGFKHIVMKPQPVPGLDFVKATHRSPYGLISSEWHRHGTKFDWHVQIPPNTTATAFVPAQGISSVIVEGAKPDRFENGRVIFTLGSGTYHFITK